MNEDLWHRIDDYLLGQWTQEEQTAFEEKMARDEALRRAVEEQRRLIEGVELENARRLLDQVMTPQPREVIRPLWQRAAPYLAVAASVVLLITGWYLLRPPRHERLYAAHFEAAPGLPTTLGLSDDPTFEEGMIAYKQQQYEQALTRWQPLFAQGEASDTLQFYLGVAQLGRGAPKEAEALLQAVAKQPHSPYHSDARWYLALAYLRQGKQAEAQERLQALAASGTYGEQSRTLLRKIEHW